MIANYFGFALGIAFIVIMVASGLMTPARKLFANSLRDAWNSKKRVEAYLARTAAGPLAAILFSFAGALLTILVTVACVICSPDVQHVSLPALTFFLVVSIPLLIFAVVYGIYMLGGRAQYLLDEHGAPRTFPTYAQDEHDHYLDETGNVICYRPDEPVQLDALGRKLRYYRTASGQMRDASNDTPFLYGNKRNMAFNNAGIALRYLQEGGHWYDGQSTSRTQLTGDDLTNAINNPEALLEPRIEINLKAVCSNEDLRVPHDLSDGPIIDEEATGRNHFSRVRIVRVITLVVAGTMLAAFALGILALSVGRVETYRINSQLPTILWGNTFLFDLAGLLVFLALSFILAIIVPCLWAFKKGVKFIEFIASTGASEALLFLIQYTQQNIGTFKGINIVDEDWVVAVILGAFVATMANLLLFFTPVHLVTHWEVASFMLGLMLIYGAWNAIYARHGGKDHVVKDRHGLIRAVRCSIIALYVLVALISRIDSVRNTFLLMLAQTSNANSEVNTLLQGGYTVHLFGFWSGVGFVIVAVGAFFLFAKGKELIGTEDAGSFQRFVGRFHGFFALIASLAGGIGLILLITSVAGASVFTVPKAVGYRIPHDPPTAPVLDAATKSNGPKGSLVTVTWVDHAGNENAFDIEREDNAGSGWEKLGSVPNGKTSFTDNNVNIGVSYHYRITAVNEAGRSASNVSDWVGFIPAPVVPGRLATKAAATQAAHLRALQKSTPTVRLASAKRDEGLDPEFLANYRDLNGKEP